MNSHSSHESENPSTQSESKADGIIPPHSSEHATQSDIDVGGTVEGSLIPSRSSEDGSPIISVASTGDTEIAAVASAASLAPLTRDGVTSETLAANGIYKPNLKELVDKYGYKEKDGPGFIIPYHDRNGNPIIDGDRPYTRCRLDTPVLKTNKKTGKERRAKYLQLFDSCLHIYVPKSFDSNYKDSLVIVEGEIKALSLVEAGIPALAISGFWSYQKDNILIPELVEIMQALKPNRLLYLGDSDTSHNADFSKAAVRMAKLVSPVWVVLPRIPVDQEKGIDDVRHDLGSDFPSFWEKIVDTSVLVSPTTDPERLSLFLLEREVDKIANLTKDERDELLPRLEKIGKFTTKHFMPKFQELFARAGF